MYGMMDHQWISAIECGEININLTEYRDTVSYKDRNSLFVCVIQHNYKKDRIC